MSQPRESLRRKRSARLAAVQAIYHFELSNRKPSAAQLKDTIVAQWKDSINGQDLEWPSDDLPDNALLGDVIEGVTSNIAIIDKAMEHVIKDNWKAERIDSVMRAVLRCATYELQQYPDRRSATIVDEYMAVSHGFFDESELAFTNSALHQLVSYLRSAE